MQRYFSIFWLRGCTVYNSWFLSYIILNMQDPLDDMHLNLEIVVTRERDDLYTAHCPYYPDLTGKGKTEKGAIRQLSTLILRATTHQMKTLLKQLSTEVSKFHKSYKPKDRANLSRMFFSVKIPLSGKMSQEEPFLDLESLSAEEKMLEGFLDPDLFSGRVQEYFFRPPLPPRFDSLMIGPPFSKN